MHIYIGIDVAKDKHDFYIMDRNGDKLAGPTTIKNNLSGFKLLFDTIEVIQEKVNCTKDSTYVGLESTGHYSNNLLNSLHQQSFTIFLLNPKLVSDYRKSKSLRKTKTDQTDARTIAALVRDKYQQLRPYTSQSYHMTELKAVTRYRHKLITERSQMKNSVKRLVNVLFPELESEIVDIHNLTSYTLLQELPGASYIADVHLTKLKHLISQSSHNWYGADKALRIREKARSSIGTMSAVTSFELQNTIRRIMSLSKDIAKADELIQQHQQALGYSLESIPGISIVLSATILAEIGEIKRFSHPDKLVAFTGICPSIYQSGKYLAKHAKMEKRGSKALRRAMMQAAEQVSRHTNISIVSIQRNALRVKLIV